MARRLCLALLFALLGLGATQTIPFSDNATSLVKELEADDLVALWGADNVTLLALYDPNDKAKADLATAWEAVATEHRGLFQICAADATRSVTKWMLDTFKVKKLPAILAFPSRLTTSKPLPMLYKGTMNATTIAKWALKQLPFTLVSKISSEANLKSLKAIAETPKAVIFHNDTEVSPEIRSLSLTFADRLSFAEVKVRTNKTLRVAEKEGVTVFPTLTIYKEKDEKVTFDGDVGNFEALQAFMETNALSIEGRDAIRKERRERREKEDEERRAREAREKAERDAKKRAEAAERKRRRREKRKIVKARDEAYRAVEMQWADEDGEYIQVRETGWDHVPDALLA